MTNCQFTMKDGTQCQSQPIKRAAFCFVHNPTTKEAHKQAAKRGGSVTQEKGMVALKHLDLKDARMILFLFADTINRVRCVRPDGSMDIKTANCIGFLGSKMLEAQKQLDLERRIIALEEVMQDQR